MPRVKIGDEDFEILDITGSNKTWLEKNLGDLSKQSAGKQLAVGGVSGWCSGYVFGKIGKAAAAAVGGSLLILQVAHHQGYITVNWGQVETSMKKAKRRLEKKSKGTDFSAVVTEVSEFVKDNMFVAGGFAAGFLLGLAT